MNAADIEIANTNACLPILFWVLNVYHANLMIIFKYSSKLHSRLHTYPVSAIALVGNRTSVVAPTRFSSKTKNIPLGKWLQVTQIWQGIHNRQIAFQNYFKIHRRNTKPKSYFNPQHLIQYQKYTWTVRWCTTEYHPGKNLYSSRGCFSVKEWKFADTRKPAFAEISISMASFPASICGKE